MLAALRIVSACSPRRRAHHSPHGAPALCRCRYHGTMVPGGAEFNIFQTKFVRGWNSLFSTDFIAFGTQVSCERAFYLPFLEIIC